MQKKDHSGLDPPPAGNRLGTCKPPAERATKKEHTEEKQYRIRRAVLQSLSMKQIAAREAKNRFGHLLDAVQSAPVRVTRKGRAIGVMMSMQHYERLRGAAWERLATTMDALEEAGANGLTEAGLEVLLADES